MNSSIIIKSTDTNNKVNQKTVTFVNPQALKSPLKLFAQGLNALTTNEYVGTSRVDKTDLEDDTEGD